MHLLSLLPFLFLLLSPASSTFVGVTVTSTDGSVSESGCMPTEFSTAGPTTAHTVSDLVYVNDGCQESDYPTTDLTGKTIAALLVEGEQSTACTVSFRVATAKQRGAVGVLLMNYLDGEVPYPLSWEYTKLLPAVQHRTTSFVGIDMAVCLAPYQLSVDVYPSESQQTGVQSIDWGLFSRWDRKNEPSTGTHTVLSVLSPLVVKDDWPAAQASFNPTTLPQVSADMVKAQWTSDCMPTPKGESRYLSYYCSECWSLPPKDKFTNAGSLASQIVLFTRPYSICYPYFYDLAITGQNAGASGIVAALSNNALPVYLAPHLVPFRTSVPFLAVQKTVGQYFEEATTAQLTVQTLIHAIHDGVGPSFFPPVGKNK